MRIMSKNARLLKMEDGIRTVTIEEAFESVKGSLIELSNKFYQIEFDDAFQIASIGFIKAWDSYKDTKIKFITYVYNCSKNELIQHLIVNNYDKRKINQFTVSLNTPVGVNKGQSRETTLIDLIKYDFNFDMLCLELDFEESIKHMKERHKDILIKKIFIGSSSSEIAKDYGVSRQAIDSMEKSAHKILRKIMFGGEMYDKCGIYQGVC